MRPTAQQFRHFGGFVAAGVSALAVDIAVLAILTEQLGWPPLLARVPAIGLAMVVSWWINRTVTFAVQSRPTLLEFGKFAAVSWISVAVNYAVFAALLMVFPKLLPSFAVVAACGVSMFVSYAGFRFGVFRPDTTAPAFEKSTSQ